ncbi:hypothetical protein EMCRGX_G026685 [Ephydatia muelleri]
MTETVRTEPAAVVAPEDPAIVEIKKRIENAFEIFDHESNKTVDVREVGTIIRSLGCCPSEAELHDMIQEVEEEEPTGFIRWEKFQPMMTRVLLEKRYQPANEEQLVRAFEVSDILLLEDLCIVGHRVHESSHRSHSLVSRLQWCNTTTVHYGDQVILMLLDITVHSIVLSTWGHNCPYMVLDRDKKSHITPDELKKYMLEEGEHFTQEEMDEMLTAAVDPDKGVVLYRDFVTLMLPDGETN